MFCVISVPPFMATQKALQILFMGKIWEGGGFLWASRPQTLFSQVYGNIFARTQTGFTSYIPSTTHHTVCFPVLNRTQASFRLESKGTRVSRLKCHADASRFQELHFQGISLPLRYKNPYPKLYPNVFERLLTSQCSGCFTVLVSLLSFDLWHHHAVSVSPFHMTGFYETQCEVHATGSHPDDQ
jgi:hypothetical protein